MIERGYDPTLGARPLKRAVQRHLEDPLAAEILAGKIPGGGKVFVKVEGDKLTFELEKQPTATT